jgi:threonine/homoserine efflux transporter RhtA
VRRPTWQGSVRGWLASFVAIALFPRLGRPERWTRARVARLAAATALLELVLRPALRRAAESQKRRRQELRIELGREPTEEELITGL